jgi:hypothetical protein
VKRNPIYNRMLKLPSDDIDGDSFEKFNFFMRTESDRDSDLWDSDTNSESGSSFWDSDDLDTDSD